MDARMQFSIITAVYNNSKTLGHAIKSIQAQQYQNIEHVIQDGGSTDGSLDVIKRFADKRTSFESAPDNGVYDAINKGILRSQGDIIGLLHSDDFFASNEVLSKIAAAFENPEVDGVYGDLQYISASDTAKIIRDWRAGTFSVEKLKYGWMPPHPTVYFRRQVFDRYGLYDTSYKIAGDYDAMLRYLGTGELQLTYLPEVLVKMRVGGISNKSLIYIFHKSFEDYRSLRSNRIGGFGSLIAKNLSKITQFTSKR